MRKKGRVLLVNSLIAAALVLLGGLTRHMYYRHLGELNMRKLVNHDPHLPLVKIEVRDDTQMLITAKSQQLLDYIDTYAYGSDGLVHKHNFGSIKPFYSRFFFSDGNFYDGVLRIPNKAGWIQIIYPYEYSDFFESYDREYCLDFDPLKEKELDEFCKFIGAY